MLRLDLGDGRAVGAAHVVGADLQVRDRVGARRPAEDQVAVLLVGVGLLRAFGDLDQPGVDGAGVVLERALELQVAGGVRRLVELPGVVVEELVAVGEEDAEHLGQGVLPAQVRADRVLGELRAERDVQRVQRRVAGRASPARS